MSFIETPRFPDGISYGAAGGPEYQTDIVTVNSGYESRNVNWSQAKGPYDVGYRLRTKVQTSDLIAFFRSVKGRAHGFRFKDWSDYEVDQSNGVLTLISAGVYQLAKSYSAGALGEIRTIKKPVAGTVAIFRTRSGTTTNITGSSVINTVTGRVTISGHAGGDTYAWSGEFDVPCRFDTDRMQVEVAGPENYSWGSIPIVEIRV